MKNLIRNAIIEYINEYDESRKKILIDELPTYLYHVTTNYTAVITSGILLSKIGLESGGLGGTESKGISFVPSYQTAKNIYDELNLINNINNSKNENELLHIINNIDDNERKEILLFYYEKYYNVYGSHKKSILASLNLTRNMLKFMNKPFYGILIFREENIKNKDIGIIKINKNQIPPNTNIIEGVDKDINEIRVLGDIPL